MGKRKAKRQSRRNSLGGIKESSRQNAIRRKSNLEASFLIWCYALLPRQPLYIKNDPDCQQRCQMSINRKIARKLRVSPQQTGMDFPVVQF